MLLTVSVAESLPMLPDVHFIWKDLFNKMIFPPRLQLLKCSKVAALNFKEDFIIFTSNI